MNSQKRLTPHSSLRGRFICDESTLIYPSLTEECLKWIMTRPLKELKVFEYGAEAGTMWWRNNVKLYEGVNSNEQVALATQTMFEEWSWGYIDSIKKSITAQAKEKFDLVIINGKWRDECIVPTLQSINKGGFILINNYHQVSRNLPPRYWKITDEVMRGYTVVVFHDEQKDNRTAVWQVV